MRPVRFGVQAIEGAAHHHWLALMNYLMRSLHTSDRSEGSVPFARGIEELLILHLLNALPHNYSADMQREPHVLMPREYRRACTYIAEHLRDSITLTDIAQTVGCSVRSLSRAFRQAMNTTPMRHLRELRLKEVHAELGRNSDGAVTIAETAVQWGFGHLGEFNYHYRQRFGESPSQTRARTRT
jgi:transcriptional regulator GlxA family with amidase domain